MDLVGPSTVVADTSSCHVDIDLGHTQRFAIVKRFDSRERVCMPFHQVGQVGKVAAAGARIDLSPFALESLAGGGDGDVDIFLGSLMNSNDRLLICRVDGLKRLAVDTLDPFVVDKSEPRLLAGRCRMVGLGLLEMWGSSATRRRKADHQCVM